MRDYIKVNAEYVQISFAQANSDRLGGLLWEGNLISHRLESNLSWNQK